MYVVHCALVPGHQKRARTAATVFSHIRYDATARTSRVERLSSYLHYGVVQWRR